jgi:hypothetical protein
MERLNWLAETSSLEHVVFACFAACDFFCMIIIRLFLSAFSQDLGRDTSHTTVLYEDASINLPSMEIAFLETIVYNTNGFRRLLRHSSWNCPPPLLSLPSG